MYDQYHQNNFSSPVNIKSQSLKYYSTETPTTIVRATAINSKWYKNHHIQFDRIDQEFTAIY
jgi:hypothetical protein